MGHTKRAGRKPKLKRPKTVLRLLDLEHSKSAVLNSLGAVSSQESYGHAIDEFITWYCSKPRLSFSRTVVLRYRIHLEQSRTLLKRACSDSLRAKRDQAVLAILLGGGLRRAEVVQLKMSDLQLREDHWVIADLVGKGRHIRTVPVPAWVKSIIDEWTREAKITEGKIFRRINKNGSIWGDGITPKAVWHIVKTAAKSADLNNVAPHDLRRTCARLCHIAGGELEQIQFLLGHLSVQTTERYLGCKQKLQHAVNDNTGLEISQ